jgi:polysaccharide export outer membrane protein
MLLRKIGLVAGCLAALARLAAADGDAPAVPSSQSDYVLQPFDLIKVVVFQEPDLEREIRLSQESAITLPLIGTVNLQGKTVREAQAIIRDLYNHDFLVNPQINVIVEEYSKVTVDVLGSVNTPGAVPIPPDRGLKLLEAITQAGGFSRLADRKHVKLTRIGADGKTATFDINADDIIQSTSSDTWVLRKDDVIFVPERIL